MRFKDQIILVLIMRFFCICSLCGHFYTLALDLFSNVAVYYEVFNRLLCD